MRVRCHCWVHFIAGFFFLISYGPTFVSLHDFTAHLPIHLLVPIFSFVTML